jgi:hypothetical protein
MMFLDCPAYLDRDGAVRCGLPAEVERHFTMSSSDGPTESAKIRCPAGHWFNGAIESLTRETRDKHDLGPAGFVFRAERDTAPGSHDRRDDGRFVVPTFSAEPGQDIARPNSAPAYYQGRPVRLWLSAMRQRRSRTAPHHMMETVTGCREQTSSEHSLLAEAGSKLPA